MGAADRLRRGGRRVWADPWLLIGVVVGVLLICAWVVWTIHVWSDKGARQGIGVLIVWPAIAAVVGLISIPFVWAFRVIRGSTRSGEQEAEAGSDSADAEATETG